MASPTPAIEKARQSSLRKLCERLGYEFKDIGLLDRALTHASMGNEGKKSYERLEFLGEVLPQFREGLARIDERLPRFLFQHRPHPFIENLASSHANYGYNQKGDHQIQKNLRHE